jgi:hypothetical protein
MWKALVILASLPVASALIPLIDGGKGMPKLYDGYFNDQIAKQASTAVSKAIAAGKKNIEVQFPPVPNLYVSSFFVSVAISRQPRLIAHYSSSFPVHSSLQ